MVECPRKSDGCQSACATCGRCACSCVCLRQLRASEERSLTETIRRSPRRLAPLWSGDPPGSECLPDPTGDKP
jgi:hypothetical protein